jgi:hypothetical protein
MAATPTIVDRGAAGDLFFRVVDVLLDASYPAGGYPLTPAQLGFGANGVIFAVIAGFDKAGTGWSIGWDYTNSKLQVFDGSGAANAVQHQVIATTVLTGIIARIIALGRGQG